MSTAEKTTTLRLRRVRFKNGNTVEVLRPRKGMDIEREFKKSSDKMLSHDRKMAGFATVCWYDNGDVKTDYEDSYNSNLRVGSVPEYVRDCLLAEMSRRW